MSVEPIAMRPSIITNRFRYKEYEQSLIEQKKTKEEATINSLKMANTNAQTALNGQIAMDGWAGKVADKVSALWKSKNRAHLVQSDIDTHKSQIEELNKAIVDNNFEKKFKEIFDVDYNQANIDAFNSNSKTLVAATTAKCISDVTKDVLKPEIDKYKANKGILQDKTIIASTYAERGNPFYTYNITKEQTFDEFETALNELVGGKKTLDKILNTKYKITEKSSLQDKYKALNDFANYLIDINEKSFKSISGGKSFDKIKDEYDNSYKKAYGTKNDIQKRVNDYNRSQEIGSNVVKSVARSFVVTAILATSGGVSPLIVGSTATMGAKFLADVSDKATNGIDDKIDLSSEEIGKLAKKAIVSGADYFVSRGIKNIIPTPDLGNDIANKALKLTKNAAVDTTVGLTADYITDKKFYANEIIPRMIISITFNSINPNDETIKHLLKYTKSGTSQAMKKSLRNYSSVKTFVNETRIKLQEQFENDPEKFGEFQLFAMKYPEKYEEVMAHYLNEYLDGTNV